MTKVLVSVLKKILVSLLAEKVLTKVLIALMEYFAGKTTNELDDEIVGIVKEKLNETE